MADVFISYKREERNAVQRLASTLRSLGLDVWFDASMSAGETFSDEIDREVRGAKAMLVCWSPSARESRWVKAEALIGFQRDVLAAAYVAGPDGFEPPTPFNSIHAEDLRAWLHAPSDAHAGWRSLLRRIGRLCAREDMESWGAISPQADTEELRAWLGLHGTSPLFLSVESQLRAREQQDVERAELERAARERLAREAAERRAREEAERRAREERERQAREEREARRAREAAAVRAQAQRDERENEIRAVESARSRRSVAGAAGSVIAVVATAWGLWLATLPAKAERSASFRIERPVATVYALLASTPESLPIGEGISQTVTALDLRKTVEASIAFNGKLAKATYALTPADGATDITVAVSQNLGFNPIERSQGMSGAQLDPVVATIAAWTDNEAGKVPDVDFADLIYEVATVPARPFLYLEGSTTRGEGQIAEGARQATNILTTVFTYNNLAPSNPIAVETAWTGDTYSFNFGFPYVGQRPAILIGVKAGETPSGAAIKVHYTGAEATIAPAVYDKIDALIAATRLAEITHFEEFLDDPSQPGGSRNRFVYVIVTGNTELSHIAPTARAP